MKLAILCFAKQRATLIHQQLCAARPALLRLKKLSKLDRLIPTTIHLPGIYVHRLIQGEHEKRIEQRTTRPAA